MIGGIFIGLCESFSLSYISTQYSDLIVFGILIAVMLLRPQGIFGTPPLQKV
jgi:branched-chain amino acid transport system permease protein